MNLRKKAQGMECLVRMPGICSGDNQTVVLAHIRMAGITGAGQKAHDLLGAWCCQSCHDEIDRRTRITDADYAKLCHLEGVIRTQYRLLKDEVIKIE